MIRHPWGNDLLLITQHDHALLSGRLAERIAGGPVSTPSSKTIEGISLHDCGWPLHDDRPTLNEQGQPLHVFEAPVWVATQVWSASARRASNKDPYAGLLVSLHVLNLSNLSGHAQQRSAQELFELNKFQHQQIELQEQLRGQLGLRVDLPLTYGLAKPGTSPSEDALLFNYHLLRAMDVLSLAALCSEELFGSVEMDSRPGGEPVQFQIARPREFELRLSPWPFDSDQLVFEVPARRLQTRSFRTSQQFHAAYASAPVERIEVIFGGTPDSVEAQNGIQ